MASVTVVIPSHNRSAMLRRAILSAMCADEVIVYDDCSMDDSVAIAEHFPVTVVQAEERCGSPAAAINYAIENATSDWLMVLADDDYFFPGAIQDIQPFLAGDWLFSDVSIGDEDGVIRGLWEYPDRPTDPDGLVQFVREHRMNPIPMVGPWRLEWLRENNLRFIQWENTGFSDDCRTLLEWVKHAPTITYIPKSFHVYRQHSEQMSHEDRDTFLRELERYFEQGG